MIVCELLVGNAPAELVRIRDVSEIGLKIVTGRALVIGEYVRVRMPDAADFCPVRVVWCDRGMAGLAFLRAVDLPMVVTTSMPGGATPSRQFADGQLVTAARHTALR